MEPFARVGIALRSYVTVAPADVHTAKRGSTSMLAVVVEQSSSSPDDIRGMPGLTAVARAHSRRSYTYRSQSFVNEKFNGVTCARQSTCRIHFLSKLFAVTRTNRCIRYKLFAPHEFYARSFPSDMAMLKNNNNNNAQSVFLAREILLSIRQGSKAGMERREFLRGNLSGSRFFWARPQDRKCVSSKVSPSRG